LKALFPDEKVKEIDDRIKQLKSNKNSQFISKDNLNAHSQPNISLADNAHGIIYYLLQIFLINFTAKLIN